MCIIPYGTQEGEISFCAYNTGIGWRNIIEHMHMNATVAEWFKEHGKHEVFAGGKEVPLADFNHQLVVDPVDAARVRDRGDAPLTAHEEDTERKKAFREAKRIREYYEETVLKKKKTSSVVEFKIGNGSATGGQPPNGGGNGMATATEMAMGTATATPTAMQRPWRSSRSPVGSAISPLKSTGLIAPGPRVKENDAWTRLASPTASAFPAGAACRRSRVRRSPASSVSSGASGG